MRRRRVGRLFVAGMLIASWGVARAELEYGLEAGVGYTDNLFRLPDDEIDETILVGGFDLLWVERRRRLDADVDIDLAYHEYLDDTAESELLGSADGLLVFGLIPERFTWSVHDTFGQAQQDPFAPPTPETRENVNYFTTGPDLVIRFGSAATMRLLGRYSWSEFEESPLDSERSVGGVSFSLGTSERSRLSLNGIVEQVDFDDPFSVDFDRNIASLTYALSAARTEITAEAGYAWIDKDNGEEITGPLGRLDVVRRISDATSITLSLGKQLTDTAEVLRTGLDSDLVGAAEVTATADTFDNQFADLGWRFSRHRTILTLSAAWQEDEYHTETQFDRESWTYEAAVERELTRTLVLRLEGSLISEEFSNTGEEADETRAEVALSWQFGRNFGLRLSGERLDRDANTELGDSVENRGFLTLLYRPTAAP